MRIAICDDEAIYIEQVKAVADRYTECRSKQHLELDAFTHPDDLLEASAKIGGYDIYVLDILMPEMNGIALGTKLRDAGYSGKIIYLTSSSEYSLDAFSVRAFDYLIKPINEQLFFKALDEAAALISERQNKYILVKTKDRNIKLSFDSILYAALNHRVVTYYLSDGRTVESTSLRGAFTDAVAELLEDERFNLCSVGMVVNLDHITEIENDAIVFGNTYRPFLGEKLCRKLRGIWSEHLFRMEV